jgi:hypothetical protein
VFFFESTTALDIDTEVRSDDVPKAYYYDASAIIQRLRHVSAERAGTPLLLLGITSVPLAQQETTSTGTDWEYDYFGVWPPQPGGQPLNGPPSIGVVSINLWARRYEHLAYRTTAQYLEHLIVAFLGDTLSRGILTHARFRRCVFDYNEDLDSIVDSVRSAKLCKQCSEYLGDDRNLGPLGARVGGKMITGAFNAILKDIRRPPARAVFQVLQQDGTFSILILGVLAAIGINLLSNWLTSSPFETAAIIVAFGLLFGWTVWRYLRPGPPLR